MHDSEAPRNFLQKLSLQSLDKKQQNLHVLKWVAESPNYAVRVSRETAAIEFLGVSNRTVERWLHGASNSGFTPIALEQKKPVPYAWQAFINGAWAAERSKGTKATPSWVYQLVKEEAEKQQQNSYPSYKFVVHFLHSLED